MPGRQPDRRPDRPRRRGAARVGDARPFRALLIRQVKAQRAQNAGRAHRRRLPVLRLLRRATRGRHLRPQALARRDALGEGRRLGRRLGRQRLDLPLLLSGGLRARTPAARAGGAPRRRPARQRRRPEPERRSVALFSNAGDWVTCHRAGAAVVSTFPKTPTASAAADGPTFVPRRRAARDHRPGRLHSGRRLRHLERHLVRAPVLAGELAQAQLDGSGGSRPHGPGQCVDRAWNAITACSRGRAAMTAPSRHRRRSPSAPAAVRALPGRRRGQDGRPRRAAHPDPLAHRAAAAHRPHIGRGRPAGHLAGPGPQRAVDHRPARSAAVADRRRAPRGVAGREERRRADATSSSPTTSSRRPSTARRTVLRSDGRGGCGSTSPRCPSAAASSSGVIAFADRPDYAAVAEALGMPIGSIGPTRGRCLAKLRAQLADDPDWEA